MQIITVGNFIAITKNMNIQFAKNMGESTRKHSPAQCNALLSAWNPSCQPVLAVPAIWCLWSWNQTGVQTCNFNCSHDHVCVDCHFFWIESFRKRVKGPHVWETYFSIVNQHVFDFTTGIFDSFTLTTKICCFAKSIHKLNFRWLHVPIVVRIVVYLLMLPKNRILHRSSDHKADFPMDRKCG